MFESLSPRSSIAFTARRVVLTTKGNCRTTIWQLCRREPLRTTRPCEICKYLGRSLSIGCVQQAFGYVSSSSSQGTHGKNGRPSKPSSLLTVRARGGGAPAVIRNYPSLIVTSSSSTPYADHTAGQLLFPLSGSRVKLAISHVFRICQAARWRRTCMCS